MIFLAAALASSTATVVAMFSLIRALQDSVGAQLDQYGANIIVVPRSESLSVSYGGFNLSGVSYDVRPLTSRDVDNAWLIPLHNRLSTVAPKLLKPISEGGKNFIVAGVDFPSEFRLKQWWEIKGRKPENDNELLAGLAAAKRFGLVSVEETPSAVSGDHAHSSRAVGITDLPRILQIRDKEFLVVGVIQETGTSEDEFLFADLRTIQRLFQSSDEITLMEISALCNGCPIEDIVAQLASAIPGGRVSAVQQAVKARLQTVQKLVRFSYAIAAVVLLVAFLVVWVSMMSSVSERTGEIGIFRAIGFRNGHVLRMIFAEVMIVSLFGGVGGCVAGFISGRLASPYFVEGASRIKPDPKLFLGSVLLALFVSLIASLYPASKAVRLDPVEAVRSL